MRRGSAGVGMGMGMGMGMGAGVAGAPGGVAGGGGGGGGGGGEGGDFISYLAKPPAYTGQWAQAVALGPPYSWLVCVHSLW